MLVGSFTVTEPITPVPVLPELPAAIGSALVELTLLNTAAPLSLVATELLPVTCTVRVPVSPE